MTTKTKGVAHRYFYIAVLCFVEGEIQALIYFFIGGFKVDCRWYNAVFDSKNRCHCLYCPCSTEQVSCHRLGRVDIDIISVFAKNFEYSFRFCNITQWCRSTVHIDSIDFVC